MTTALRVLLVGDTDDALLLRELGRGGYDAVLQRAGTPKAPAHLRSQEG